MALTTLVLIILVVLVILVTLVYSSREDFSIRQSLINFAVKHTPVGVLNLEERICDAAASKGIDKSRCLNAFATCKSKCKDCRKCLQKSY